MNNADITTRISELERELCALRSEGADPMLKLRIRREEVLTRECGFPRLMLSSNFGSPMLMLIRNAAGVNSNIFRQLANTDCYDLIYSMQDELLSVVSKYSKLFKDKKTQYVKYSLDDLYSAAREYKSVKDLGFCDEEACARLTCIANSLIDAGYTKEELKILLRLNT